MDIHETAVVDKSAKLGKNVTIGPFSVIGPDVSIGDNCTVENNVTINGNVKIESETYIGPNCNIGGKTSFMSSAKEIIRYDSDIVINKGNHFDSSITIKGRVEIDENNFIGAFTTLGLPAQDRGNSEKPVFLRIGKNNDIREYVSVNCGSHGGTGTTSIGDNNMLMAYVHMGHDCTMGNNCTIANGASFAGHVEIGSFIVTGGFAGVHQFCKIGDFAMVGGMSGIAQDVPPYVMVSGARAKVIGINSIGLSRNGFSDEDLKTVKSIFKIFFRDMLPTKKALEKMKEEIENCTILNRFVNFVERSDRGILKML